MIYLLDDLENYELGFAHNCLACHSECQNPDKTKSFFAPERAWNANGGSLHWIRNRLSFESLNTPSGNNYGTKRIVVFVFVSLDTWIDVYDVVVRMKRFVRECLR